MMNMLKVVLGIGVVCAFLEAVFARPLIACGNVPCVTPLNQISCTDLMEQYQFFGSCCRLENIPETGGCRVVVGGGGNCMWIPWCGVCDPIEGFGCNIEYRTWTSQPCPKLDFNALLIQGNTGKTNTPSAPPIEGQSPAPTFMTVPRLTCPPNQYQGNRGNQSSDMLNSCYPVGNATACLDVEGCFWCSDKEVCRGSFGQCPGNELVVGKVNVCAPLKNETDCTDIDECFWCDDNELCRASEEECPGQGRDNPCRESETLDDCTAKDECDWLEQAGMCVGARGAGGIADGNNGQNNQTGRDVIECPLLANKDTCALQNTCRWCPSVEGCKRVSDRCEDGSLGERGNPCRMADSELLCGDALGCLWCLDAGRCAKATNDACKIDDDDDDDDPITDGNSTQPCGRQDAGPECSEIEGCQWCRDQSKCKESQAQCFAPSGSVDLGVTEGQGGAFNIRDDGLGSTDPNAVSVVLSYLYEIDSDGVTIDASLVDLEFQEFEVKESIGRFFEGIEARRFTFEASIEGAGTVKMNANIILTDGTISTDFEEWPVQAGDVKFNVELSEWTFCGETSPCGNATATGEYIDLVFHIGGKAQSPEQSEDDALLFNLGGNVPLLLSSRVEVDGFMQNMPDGFPRAESTEAQGTVFVFRFPRFQGAAEYDSVIPYHTSIGSVGTDDATDGGSTPTTSPTRAPIPLPSPPPTTAPTIKLVLETKSSSNDDDSFSGGSMAGIIIGSVLGLCLCCAAVGGVLRRRGSSSSDSADNNNIMQDDEDLFEDEANDEMGAAIGGDEEEDEGDDDDNDNDNDDGSGAVEEDEEENEGSEEENEDGDEESEDDDSEVESEEDSRSLV